MRPSRTLITAAALATLALGAATLAPATARAQGARRDDITRLERARDRNPRSAAALRALGVAYYRAGRYDDARRTLEQARTLARNDGTVALYLGMSAEHAGDLAAARSAYSDYLARGRGVGATRRQVRARLALLRRQELVESAKAAVAQESALAAQAGAPTTIAVLPLGYGGGDPSLAPLGRGLADLLVTDLSRSPKLTVVERERIQALVDEIARSGTGRVDSATALRSGHLLRAGRVVSGGLAQRDDRQLQVDAAVIAVATAQAGRAVERSDQLEQLFAIEKQLALDLFDALGVTLTPAERAQVEQRPTRSLAAFLAYSAGLMAEDNGNLDDASRRFGDALRLDPNFRLARDHKETVDAAREGQTVTTATIEATLAGTTEGLMGSSPYAGTLTGVINDLNPQPLGDAAGGDTPPSPRDPASTTTGTDNPAAGSGRVRVVIPQPSPRRARPGADSSLPSPALRAGSGHAVRD